MGVFGGIAVWAFDRSADIQGEQEQELLTDPVNILLLLLVGVPTVIIVLGVLGLVFFHTALICLGRTTREVCRPKKRRGEGATLCGFRGPSLIPARLRARFLTPAASVVSGCVDVKEV